MAALPIGKPSHGSAERAFVSISNNADCGGMIILVVEDEFIVREDIASYLRHAGWVVIEADSGSRAVAMCGSTDTPVDVLFTDIQLNDSVSGWEVAEAFRAARGNLPVIYTSGNPIESTRAVPGSLQFNKPYQPADILRACQRFKVLKHRGSTS
jgi:CheY-like chemotaxis protein